MTAGYKAKSEGVAHAVQYQANPLPPGGVRGVELLDSYCLPGINVSVIISDSYVYMSLIMIFPYCLYLALLCCFC